MGPTEQEERQSYTYEYTVETELRTELRARATGLSFSPGTILYALRRFCISFEEELPKTAIERRRDGEILGAILVEATAWLGLDPAEGFRGSKQKRKCRRLRGEGQTSRTQTETRLDHMTERAVLAWRRGPTLRRPYIL